VRYPASRPEGDRSHDEPTLDRRMRRMRREHHLGMEGHSLWTSQKVPAPSSGRSITEQDVSVSHPMPSRIGNGNLSSGYLYPFQYHEESSCLYNFHPLLDQNLIRLLDIFKEKVYIYCVVCFPALSSSPLLTLR
jgi:hypothetical protein